MVIAKKYISHKFYKECLCHLTVFAIRLTSVYEFLHFSTKPSAIITVAQKFVGDNLLELP